MKESTDVEIVDVSYRADDAVILDNLTARIPGGGITALVGPNGAGKTTLLRCLSGELQPSAGSVLFGGQRVDLGSDNWKRQIGVVPDSDAIFEELTVREQLSLAATLFGVSRSEEQTRIQSLLLVSRLAEREQALGSELSAGMRKRLSFALALIHAPRVLLFDEPLNALDYASADTFIRLLRYLRSVGRTTLVSGHSLPMLLAAADHVLELESGRAVNEFDIDGMTVDDALRKLKTVAPTLELHEEIALSWMGK